MPDWPYFLKVRRAAEHRRLFELRELQLHAAEAGGHVLAVQPVERGLGIEGLEM